MSRKHFSVLLGVTLVAALLVLLVPGKTGRESGLEKSRLLPGLQQQVNELDWLRVTGPGGEVVVTLSRDDEFWRVAEAHEYPADWGRLRTLLADLAQAEVVELKTDNPQYYDRLGVEDVDQAGAGGVLLEFDSGSGLPGLIVGKRAQGLEGQYARLQDSAVSVLLDRVIEVPQDRASWLDRDVVDIADAEVVEVDIRHPDGERVVARKVSAEDDNFVLQDVPEGREIRSAWTVNALANALSALTLEEVVPDSGIDWSAATRFGLVTADGLRIDVDLVSVASGDDSEADGEEQNWIRVTAGVYETALDRALQSEQETAQAADDAAADAPLAQIEADPEADAEVDVQAGAADASERAGTLNLRLAGWAYRIPQYKADAMNKRMEDLLQAESAEDD